MKEMGCVKQNSLRENTEIWVWSWPHGMKYGGGVSSEVSLEDQEEMSYFILWLFFFNLVKTRRGFQKVVI